MASPKIVQLIAFLDTDTSNGQQIHRLYAVGANGCAYQWSTAYNTWLVLPRLPDDPTHYVQ